MVAIAGVLGALALLALVLLATGAGEGGKSYEVRAIFDDAANIISGEDVKIEGAKVGVVGNVTPTPEQTAAVVLHIENPGFQDFRADASCTIEPEALIGEKFVNCRPTQPRAVGTPLPPPLKVVPNGVEGEGQHLLPVQNTSSPVDTDLLNDINRLPVRERLTIIINEFGAGLAGRGSDLNTVIRRANPALRELNQVLGILAHQNKLLAKLARDSDVALQPLPRIKEHISNFIVSSDKVARASANQRGNIAKNFAKFPAFLEQLGRSMEHNVPFAEETTRTFTALKPAAPGINKLFANLGPFSNSSTEFFESLGKTAKRAGPSARGAGPAAGQGQEARDRRQTVQQQPRRTVHEPARHGRARADHGLHLPGHGDDQRLRRPRALPARRRRREHVHHLRDPTRIRVRRQVLRHDRRLGRRRRSEQGQREQGQSKSDEPGHGSARWRC